MGRSPTVPRASPSSTATIKPPPTKPDRAKWTAVAVARRPLEERVPGRKRVGPVSARRVIGRQFIVEQLGFRLA